MIANAQLQDFAFVIGFIAITNWIIGDRSILGRQLLLRESTTFRLLRYVGLGLFAVALILSMVSDWKSLVRVLAYAGAGMMLIGTAKKCAERKSVDLEAGDKVSGSE